MLAEAKEIMHSAVIRGLFAGRFPIAGGKLAQKLHVKPQKTASSTASCCLIGSEDNGNRAKLILLFEPFLNIIYIKHYIAWRQAEVNFYLSILSEIGMVFQY